MNSSARLLAVIGYSCALAGCNVGTGEADESEVLASPATSLGESELGGVLTASPPDAEPEASANTDVRAGDVTVADDQSPAEVDPIGDGDHPAASIADSELVIDADGDIESDTVTDDAPADDIDADSESRYTYSDDHDPNGIGKFYMGREIAQVMGHQGIAWLERPEREQEEGLSLLIDCLDIEPGSTVADIGAGSGVLTVRFCEAVGEDGTVVAVDIQQEMLDALQLKCHEMGFRNVELVLGSPESPMLPEATIDLAVMVDVYHEFDHPYEMLLDISRSLRPGGRVVFVEYRKEDPTVPIKEVHKMTEAQVRLEAEQPEFQLEYVETIEDLPRQHVIVFRRIEADDVETPEGSDQPQ